MRPPQEQPSQNPRRHDPTLVALGRFIVLFGLSVFIAAMAPAAHFASVLSTFLFVAAAITALYAMRQSEKLSPEHLTQWDVSAALMALSLLARFFEKT